MIAEAALDEEARRMGLGQSDAETVRTIYNDPNFKGLDGQFDPARFQAIIRQFGYTEQRYIAEQRRVSLRRQIAGTITGRARAAEDAVEALNHFQNEQRSIEYVKLDAAQAGTIDPPSPETLAAYFEDHKAQFRAPEYRKIAFVVMTPEEIGKWITVSDEDAKKIFEQRRDKLGTPEKRANLADRVSEHGRGQGRARAASPRARRSRISPRSASSTPSDVDLGTDHQIRDHRSRDRGCRLLAAAGEVSEPVQGQFGVALVKVGKIEPGAMPSYESVADRIKNEIATERARAKVAELHNKMEDERGGGASVVEAAQKLGLDGRHDRRRRSLRPHAERTARHQIFRAASTWSRRPSTATSASTTTRSSSTAAMSGTTCSASRRRAIAPSTRSSDQVEARWREEQVSSRLRTKATEMVQKLNKAASSPTRPRAPA